MQSAFNAFQDIVPSVVVLDNNKPDSNIAMRRETMS